MVFIQGNRGGNEVTFARELVKAGFKPAIFKYSLSATSLAGDWRAPGHDGLYDKMTVELKPEGTNELCS